MLLYAATIFASAFLLFLVQPVIAKEILPWFGGSAAVWTTCLVFFQVALGAGLIGGERPSNRTDIAYLFYLPFSMVFVSSDDLHRRTAPLFMRPDQAFVWGIDLKPALKAPGVRTHGH